LPFVSPVYFPMVMVLLQLLVFTFSPDYFHKQFEPPEALIYWTGMTVLGMLSVLQNWNLIPILGLATCCYLLTGMSANNWFWFFVWFGIGLLVYFAYGYKKSKLARG